MPFLKLWETVSSVQYLSYPNLYVQRVSVINSIIFLIIKVVPSKRIIPWFHVMKNLKEFYNKEKATYLENDLLDKPHIRAPNSPREIRVPRVPIFHWNFGRMMGDPTPSCTSHGCVVKSYRKLWKNSENYRKIWKRTSNTMGKLDDGLENKIIQTNPELQLTIPIQYNLVKILVSSISSL